MLITPTCVCCVTVYVNSVRFVRLRLSVLRMRDGIQCDTHVP